MAREYSIKIIAWKKYQGREVKTRSSWLRFENDFIESPNFSEFNSEERVVWIFALCCASKLNTDTLQVPHQCSHRVLHRCTGIDENVFHRTFEKLKKLQLVEIRTTRGRYADVTSKNADDTQTTHYEDETRRDETRRDETRRDEDETKYSCADVENHVTAISDFDSFPRAKEIIEGFKVNPKVQKAWIDAYQDAAWIASEVLKAIAWIEVNPKKRPKSFARFMGGWLSRGWEQHRRTLPSTQPAANRDYSFLSEAK